MVLPLLRSSAAAGPLPNAGEVLNEEQRRPSTAKSPMPRCGDPLPPPCTQARCSRRNSVGLAIAATQRRTVVRPSLHAGEVLEEEEYLRRKDYYMSVGQRHYYFMNIGNGEVIDACRKVGRTGNGSERVT